MKKLTFYLFALLLTALNSKAQNTIAMKENVNNNKLAVLWTSGDPEVAEKVCFMYTNNAKKQAWFDEVVLIIWGPSAKLLTENSELQEYVKRMQNSGVKVEACLACANMYGVAEKLRSFNIDVKGMGVPLTNYMKNGWHVLSF